MRRFIRLRPGVAYDLRRSLIGWTLDLGDRMVYHFRKRSNGWEWKERWSGERWRYAYDLKQAVGMAERNATERSASAALEKVS